MLSYSTGAASFVVQSAVAATVTVNSTADTNARDEMITLREALLLVTGKLSLQELTAKECAQISRNSYQQQICTSADTIGATSADTIVFSPTIFQPVKAATIIIASPLEMSTGSDTIDATVTGVNVLAMSTGAFPCLTITASRNTIRGIDLIKGCSDGILITNNGQGNVIGGVGNAERNVITGNLGDGVKIDGVETIGNMIRGNLIYANSGLAINNINGGNAELALPILKNIFPFTRGKNVFSLVTGVACSGCSVDIYSDNATQAQTYEGSAVADANGLLFAFVRKSVGPNLTAATIDKTGNTSELGLLFTDTTPPETLIQSGPSGTVNNTTATFTFSSNEPGVSFECGLDGEEEDLCTPPITYRNLSNGTHTFEVRAVDVTGNVDLTPAEQTWTIARSTDRTPPNATINSGPSGTVSDTSAVFTFSSDESGSTFICALDGAAFSACSSPFSYNGLAAGPHIFQVQAVDIAGNVDPSPATQTWNVITTPLATLYPKVTIHADVTETVTTSLQAIESEHRLFLPTILSTPDESVNSGKPIVANQAVASAAALSVTHGVASGDISATSAIIWARANEASTMNVEYDTAPLFSQPQVRQAAAINETDFTAKVKLDGLTANTTYYYRVWFSNGSTNSAMVVGSFKTAPDPSVSQPVSFIISGDLGGANYCRRIAAGYAIFAQMQALAPSFFINNGDLIYADGICPVEGPDGPGGWENIWGDFRSVKSSTVDWTNVALVRDIFLRHWRYNRADLSLQNFLQQTPMYSQWDDHEVLDDFGASWTYWNVNYTNRAGYSTVVSEGRRALFDYAPIAQNPTEPNHIYRRFNWGKSLDLFILDARSYRSRNDIKDTVANNKALLGPQQMEWLKQSLLNSTATWKIISSDVPLSIPTGSDCTIVGRDGYANGTVCTEYGFERELLNLIKFLDDANITNVVFVTTDAHFAQTAWYITNVNGDADQFTFYEVVAPPLSANRLQPKTLDKTLNPTSLYAEGGIFGFAYIRTHQGADDKMHLLMDVRGEDGQARPGSLLDLTPQ